MGCRRTSSTTLLMVILAIFFLLALDRPIIAHARHVKSPSMWAGEHSSTKDERLQGTGNVGVDHTKTKNKNTETVHVEKGSRGEAAVEASFGRGGNSPAASGEKIVVARYGPRPHPKKHN